MSALCVYCFKLTTAFLHVGNSACQVYWVLSGHVHARTVQIHVQVNMQDGVLKLHQVADQVEAANC